MFGFGNKPHNQWLRIGDEFINLDNVAKIEFEPNDNRNHDEPWKLSVWWNDGSGESVYYLTHAGRKVIIEALGYAD